MLILFVCASAAFPAAGWTIWHVGFIVYLYSKGMDLSQELTDRCRTIARRGAS
jgi:hypothetical protein